MSANGRVLTANHIKDFFLHILPPIFFSLNNERLPREPSGLRASQVSVVRSLGTVYPRQKLLSRTNHTLFIL